jgi:hypothetical protein
VTEKDDDDDDMACFKNRGGSKCCTTWPMGREGDEDIIIQGDTAKPGSNFGAGQQRKEKKNEEHGMDKWSEARWSLLPSQADEI